MSENSKQAYYNEANEKSRISKKKMCLIALEREPDGLTYPEVSRKTGLSPDTCWKRLSDAEKIDGTVYICGSKLHGYRAYSKYKLVKQLSAFPEKRQTFRQWVKANHPDILHKYEVLIEMKL